MNLRYFLILGACLIGTKSYCLDQQTLARRFSVPDEKDFAHFEYMLERQPETGTKKSLMQRCLIHAAYGFVLGAATRSRNPDGSGALAWGLMGNYVGYPIIQGRNNFSDLEAPQLSTAFTCLSQIAGSIAGSMAIDVCYGMDRIEL